MPLVGYDEEFFSPWSMYFIFVSFQYTQSLNFSIPLFSSERFIFQFKILSMNIGPHITFMII